MATPFMHFGMYSGAAKVQSEISVTEIFINGEKLSAADFSAVEWDKIQMPLELYCYQNKNGKPFYHRNIKRLLGVIKIPSIESTFYKEITIANFLNRYKERLTSIIGKNINEIKILRSRYQYLQINDDARYILINSKDFFEQCN